MPEYDAFGRPVGEDTASVSITPQPVDSESARPAPTPAARPTSQPPRRRRSPLRVVPLVVAVVMLGIVGSAGLAVFGTVSETVDSARDSFSELSDAVKEPAPSPFPGSDAGATEPADGPSLLTAGGMAQAKAKLRRVAPGRIRTFRVEAGRIDLQAVKGGRTRVVQYQRGAEAARVLTTVSIGSAIATMPYSALDVRAPRRLIAAGARRLGKPRDRINYLVASRGVGDAISWTAFWRDGDFARGDARGRLTDVYRG